MTQVTTDIPKSGESPEGSGQRASVKHQLSASVLIALLALATFQTLWRGYTVATSDHSVQIPFLKHAIDASLYPNDAMIETSKKYVSYHPRILAGLVRVFKNIEVLFFAIHLLSVFAFLLLLYQLSLFLFGDKVSAVLCLVLMLPRRLVLGKSAIYLGGMYPSFVTLPLALLAILLFFRRRRVLAFCVLGITANSQMLVAFYAFCMLAAWTVAEQLDRLFREKREFDWKRVLPWDLVLPIGAFIVCALPVLVWSVRSHAPITDEWIRLLRVRSSHHSFPFSWKPEWFVDYLMLLAIALLATRHKPNRMITRQIGVFVAAVAVLCGLGVVFAEWYPVQFVLRGQFFRSTVYLTILCIFFISHHIRRLWEGPVSSRVVALVVFAVVLLPAYYPLAPMALLLLLVLEWRRGDRHPVVLLFALGVLIVRIYAKHTAFPTALTLGPVMDLLNDVFEQRLLFLCLMLTFLPLLVKAVPNRRLRLGITVLALCLFLFHLAPSTFRHYHSVDRNEKSWRAVQIWVKENTARDAMLLTPPYQAGFRIFSERSIVGDWKDGTQQYFDIDYAYEWWRRMQDLGGGSTGYDKLPPEEYTAVARKYGASYFVLPLKKEMNAKPVYANSEYAVYTVP